MRGAVLRFGDIFYIVGLGDRAHHRFENVGMQHRVAVSIEHAKGILAGSRTTVVPVDGEDAPIVGGFGYLFHVVAAVLVVTGVVHGSVLADNHRNTVVAIVGL